jgi:hypothetical protein
MSFHGYQSSTVQNYANQFNFLSSGIDLFGRPIVGKPNEGKDTFITITSAFAQIIGLLKLANIQPISNAANQINGPRSFLSWINWSYCCIPNTLAYLPCGNLKTDSKSLKA